MRPINGNTYPVKEQLKALGGYWDHVARCWMVPDSAAAEAKRLVEAVPSGSPRLVATRRTGLFAGLGGISPIVYQARATIPAVELFRQSRAIVVPAGDPEIGYQITLGSRMPEGIVAVSLNGPVNLGLRTQREPRFPGEYPDYWRQVDFTPCPICDSPVIWYEAGYVPGYRICTGEVHHHSIAK